MSESPHTPLTMPKWTVPAWLILGLLGVLLRLLWLGTVPGINGDECLFGIAAWRLLHGQKVEWMAVTGRPLMSPLYWLVSLIQTKLGVVSFVSLRLPTVASSLATVGLVGWGWRPLLGPGAAALAALLLLTSPPEIMFARFGWDPSLLSFLVALAVTFACRGRWPGLLLALALGLTTHPFYITALPLVVLVALRRLRPSWAERLLPWCLAGALLAFCLPAVVGRVMVSPDPSLLGLPRFGGAVIELLSGEATIAYLVERETAWLGSAWAIGAGLLLLVALCFEALRGRRDLVGSLLACGILLAAAALYLGMGLASIVSPQERNALTLVVPLLAWLALRLQGPLRRHSWLWLPLLLLCAFNLWRVWDRYLYSLHKWGTRSHRAFLTADVEPRQTAFARAQEWLGAHPVIVVEDWWLYQPVTYLALPYPVVVLHMDSVPDLAQALRDGAVVLAYPQGPLFQKTIQAGVPLRGLKVRQAGGREAIEVLAARPP